MEALVLEKKQKITVELEPKELRWLMTKQPFTASALFFILEHMDTKML